MTQRSFNWQDGALIQCIGCIILSFALPGLDSAPTPASTPDRSPQLTLEESGDLAPVKRTGTSIQIAHAGIPVPQKPLSDSVVSQLRKNIFDKLFRGDGLLERVETCFIIKHSTCFRPSEYNRRLSRDILTSVPLNNVDGKQCENQCHQGRNKPPSALHIQLSSRAHAQPWKTPPQRNPVADNLQQSSGNEGRPAVGCCELSSPEHISSCPLSGYTRFAQAGLKRS